MDESEIESLVSELCSMLEHEAKTHPEPENDWEEEPAVASVARAVCRRLLDAAHANGHYGCQLCQS